MKEDPAKLYKLKTEIIGRLLKICDMAMKENSITSARDAEYFGNIVSKIQLAKSLQDVKDFLQYHNIWKPKEKK